MRVGRLALLVGAVVLVSSGCQPSPGDSLVVCLEEFAAKAKHPGAAQLAIQLCKQMHAPNADSVLRERYICGIEAIRDAETPEAIEARVLACVERHPAPATR